MSSFSAHAKLALESSSPPSATVLCVEAQADRANELLEQLRADGYPALGARSAGHARALARAGPIQAILLGSLDGPRAALDLLEEIRDPAGLSIESVWAPDVPVIVLHPRATQLDLLRAFEAGADDFLCAHDRPYLELRARLRALLRRACSHQPITLRVGPVRVDTSARLVQVAGRPVALARIEYELLVHLARDPLAVCSKQELLGAIWRQQHPSSTRTVDSHAVRLRAKLRDAGAPGLVVNVWGVGYRLI